jgi:phosphate transport system protein
MSHYEQRLSADLSRIRSVIQEVGDDLDSALARAVQGIRTGDANLLHEVVLDDLSVNRKVRHIDRLCHEFVARHLPAAGHLRFVSSVLRLAIALERAGDYAVTISRVVLQLESELKGDITNEIVKLAELARSMLGDAIKAFLDGDVERARETRTHGIRIDKSYDRIFHALVEEEPRRPPLQLASLLTIFGRIERVSDQAKNICEEAVFAATGEVKAPKVFRILFFDERDDFVSQLAAAVARKGFPEKGNYTSAGWNPAANLDARLEPIADRFSLDLGRARPSKVFEELPDYPIEYHVVVAINVTDDSHLPRVPYHTVLRRWDIPTIGTNVEGIQLDDQLDATVRELTAQIRELMERLTGDVGH